MRLNALAIVVSFSFFVFLGGKTFAMGEYYYFQSSFFCSFPCLQANARELFFFSIVNYEFVCLIATVSSFIAQKYPSSMLMGMRLLLYVSVNVL